MAKLNATHEHERDPLGNCAGFYNAPDALYNKDWVTQPAQNCGQAQCMPTRHLDYTRQWAHGYYNAGNYPAHCSASSHPAHCSEDNRDVSQLAGSGTVDGKETRRQRARRRAPHLQAQQRLPEVSQAPMVDCGTSAGMLTSSSGKKDMPSSESRRGRARRAHEQQGVDRNRTTLMIRNLPIRITTERLEQQLEQMGLAGKYDLLHIPRDAHKPDCSMEGNPFHMNPIALSFATLEASLSIGSPAPLSLSDFLWNAFAGVAKAPSVGSMSKRRWHFTRNGRSIAVS